MALSWGDVITSVAFNCGIAAVCFIIFCFLRRMGPFYNFYNAKRKLAIPFRFRPRRLDGGPFSWISKVSSVPDEQIARIAGFDGLTYIKFLGLCAKISAAILVITMAALLPINLLSDNVSTIMQEQSNCSSSGSSQSGAESATTNGGVSNETSGKCSYVVTNFDKTTLTNIESNHWKLWIYIGAVYLMTIVTLYFLWNHYRKQINWRILYLSWLRRGDAGHAVLLRNIPLPSMSAPRSKIPAPMKYDSEVFEKQPKRIYEHDVNTVKPEQAVQAGTGVEPAPPSPMIARTSLSNFESRPAETDLDTFAQVDHAVKNDISMESIVTREFQRTFGTNQVQHVAVVCDDAKLAPLVGAYNEAKEKVLDLTDEWVGAMRAGSDSDSDETDTSREYIERKRVKLGGALGKATGGTIGGPGKEAQEYFGKHAQDADELEYNMFQMKTLLNSIRMEQEATSDNETQTAFVVMRTRQARAAAATGLLHADGKAWTTEGAPASNEIIWENVAAPASRRKLGATISWVLLITVMVFFLPILVALQQLVNLEGYASDGNWAQWILDAPVLGNLLKSVMPTLALVIILKIMPMIIKFLAQKVEKQPTKSAVDLSLGTKYYVFQFFIIFLFNTIIGAASSGKASGDDLPMVSLFNELRNDPSQITDWLADAIPQQAGFFFTYLLTKGILSGTIGFLRVPGAIISWISRKFSNSERAKKRTWANQYMSYGKRIPTDAIAILILLVFSFVQPLVSAAAFLYFLMASLYWKYDLLYCYRDAFQTGGMFWPVMFDMIYAPVIIMLLSAIGILGVKRAPGTPLIILLLISAIIWRIVIGRTLARPLKEMSMHTAADLDRQDLKPDWLKDVSPEEAEAMRRDNWDLEDVDLDPIPLRYVQPPLRLRNDQHDRIIADAAEASRLADAYNKDAKVANENFIQVYNSTGPFHGVPDTAESQEDTTSTAV